MNNSHFFLSSILLSTFLSILLLYNKSGQYIAKYIAPWLRNSDVGKDDDNIT